MKNLAELIPLVAFFITYKKTDLITATLVLTGLTIITSSFVYLRTKKVSIPLLISTIVIAIFGFLTWYFDNPTFIKIKPTIVNSIFAIILLAGAYYKKPLLKHILGSGIKMPEQGWHMLAVRFGIFFIAIAIFNEIIWRNFSEDFWVKFKVFGFLPISITFTLSQMPFILRQQKKLNKK